MRLEEGLKVKLNLEALHSTKKTLKYGKIIADDIYGLFDKNNELIYFGGETVVIDKITSNTVDFINISMEEPVEFKLTIDEANIALGIKKCYAADYAGSYTVEILATFGDNGEQYFNYLLELEDGRIIRSWDSVDANDIDFADEEQEMNVYKEFIKEHLKYILQKPELFNASKLERFMYMNLLGTDSDVYIIPEEDWAMLENEYNFVREDAGILATTRSCYYTPEHSVIAVTNDLLCMLKEIYKDRTDYTNRADCVNCNRWWS